jgi:hypothetical protein
MREQLLTLELFCHYVQHRSLFFLCMFWPNWPSSGVQVVMVKDSAVHCNAVFFPPVLVASGYLVMGVLVIWLWGLPSVLFGCPWVARGCFSVMCDAETCSVQ